MVGQWFYQTAEGQQSGPIDSRELRRLAEAGIVRPDTLVRQGESARWVRAEQVRGLFQRTTPPSSSLVKATLVQPPAPPPLPSAMRESGAPSRSVGGESPVRDGLIASAINEASEKPDHIHPATWAAIIMGSGAVLLVVLCVLVFRGGGEPQQQAENDQPRSSALNPEGGELLEPSASRVAAPAVKANSASASTELAGTQVYEKVAESTVTIHSFHGDTPIATGSGFILYPGEAIVTNEHVIRGASRLVVLDHGGAKAEVTVIQNVDAKRDIAVLPFSSDRLDSHGLVLALNLPKVGETVYAIGAPQGLEFTFTSGIVSQVRQGFLSFGTAIQTDVSISPGSSGGPLVNGAGEVVGINTLASKSSAEAHNLNFAVAMSEIRTVSQRSNLRALTDLDGYKTADASQTSQAPMRTISVEDFRFAAYAGKVETVRQALQAGMDVNSANSETKLTPLHMAAYNGHTKVVKLLLENGAQVDAQDHEGKTPLIHACTGPFQETVALLLEAGADINAREADGRLHATHDGGWPGTDGSRQGLASKRRGYFVTRYRWRQSHRPCSH